VFLLIIMNDFTQNNPNTCKLLKILRSEPLLSHFVIVLFTFAGLVVTVHLLRLKNCRYMIISIIINLTSSTTREQTCPWKPLLMIRLLPLTK